MRHLISALLSILILHSCIRNPESEHTDDHEDTVSVSTHAIRQITPLWEFNPVEDLPLNKRILPADSLRPQILIDILNSQFQDKVKIDFINASHDTLFIKIDSATYLTQQSGTTGANGILAVVTYTLTELDSIKYIDFNFKEGDHAVPGTYDRNYFKIRKVKVD